MDVRTLDKISPPTPGEKNAQRPSREAKGNRKARPRIHPGPGPHLRAFNGRCRGGLLLGVDRGLQELIERSLGAVALAPLLAFDEHGGRVWTTI